ncbi:MAG TPA: glycosyltransferase [Xanthobacteraceae bacterium]|jgi:GT2 family glycosyltransferase
MADHRVAIIIPCFNGGGTLAATLQSALAQDVPVEVVVIDDGSTDNSRTIAAGFEPAVRVISGPNRGVSLARNAGIAATAANWIVFLDADDLLEPGTLGKRLATAREANADVVISDWLDVHDDGSGRLTPGKRNTIDWEALAAEPELATAVQAWATTAAILYHRSIVERIGGFRVDLPIMANGAVCWFSCLRILGR